MSKSILAAGDDFLMLGALVVVCRKEKGELTKMVFLYIMEYTLTAMIEGVTAMESAKARGTCVRVTSDSGISEWTVV